MTITCQKGRTHRHYEQHSQLQKNFQIILQKFIKFDLVVMKGPLLYWFCVSGLFLPLSSAFRNQHPPYNYTPPSSPPRHPQRKQIAIIGSGIAGSTAAYFLQELFPDDHGPVDITIFEQKTEIGGRIKSVKYRNETIELGTPSWFPEDWCMNLLMSEFGLKPKPKLKTFDDESTIPETIGIWDGDRGEFVLVETDKSGFRSRWELIKVLWKGEDTWIVGNWFGRLYHKWLLGKHRVTSKWLDIGRAVWRYGWSPLSKVSRMAREELGKWGEFGRVVRWVRGMKGVVDEVERAGLDTAALGNAKTWYESHNITDKFIREVLEPASRARFGKNVDSVRIIASLLAIRDILSKATSILGGNHRLPHRLIRLSEAEVKLNHHVTKISKGENRKFKLEILWRTPMAVEWDLGFNHDQPEFDAVILAAPSHTDSWNRIKIEDFNLKFPLNIVRTEENVENTRNHVTHFATRDPLSPAYFNLSSSTPLPDKILTTRTKNESEPEFFSIEKVQQVRYRDPDCTSTYLLEEGISNCDEFVEENIYRVFSPGRIEDCELARMVGKLCGDGDEFPFVDRGEWGSGGMGFKGEDGRDKGGLEVFYTGVGEELVETAETSCKMGFNAAGKLSEKWRGRKLWWFRGNLDL